MNSIVLLVASFAALLSWPEGGERPVRTFDFGPATVGGYAVFNVKSYKPAANGALPVVRLAYATHPDGLGEKGDFQRENHINYLRMDNPVLPANVNRHELYTIPRTGKFVAPLLQGQERYVRVWLDTPGTEVEIDSFDIVNVGTHADGPLAGSFSCSDKRFAAAWAISARSCQMASIPSGDAWKIVSGVLLPRWLEKGSPDGWCRYVPSVPGSLEVTYEFRWNPHFPKGAFTVFTGWLNTEPDVVQKIEQEGPDGVIKTVSVPLKPGRFGFRLAKEQWPMIHRVVVKDENGRELWRDDFDRCDAEGRAENWVYTLAPPYIADGGKRDRLVWSGDLWWAVGTVASAMGPKDVYYPGALRLLAFNQTPEGFCQASPFAENTAKPRSGEYGHFASDEFSAWLVPSTWEWLLYSGDRTLAKELWPTIDRELRYIASHMGKDGLFKQRYETSKFAANMNCGDTSHRLLSEVIYWMGWRDGAKIARELGHDERANELERMAAEHGKAIRRSYSTPDGGWRPVLESDWKLNNGLAMLINSGLLSRNEVMALAPKVGRPGAGKMQALFARGLMRYGFTVQALAQIENGNWYAMADDDWPGAHTTSECTFLVTTGYWDESHPDTAIADIYTGYVLGVRPLKPGFRKFIVAPQMTKDLSYAEGSVPTPYGIIQAGWRRTKDGLVSLDFTVPRGTTAEIFLGKVHRVYTQGEYTVVATVSDAELADPLAAAMQRDEAPNTRTVRYVSSQRYTEKDAKYVHPIDLGSVRSVEKIVLKAGEGRRFPGAVQVEAATEKGAFTPVRGAGMPKSMLGTESVEIDLHTAAGALSARYLRLICTELPEVSPGNYTLWFDSVTVHFAE